MPVMGGSALAKNIREKEARGEFERPMPIILVSGEVLYPSMNKYQIEGRTVSLFDHSLLKPFTIEQLRDVVSLVLS